MAWSRVREVTRVSQRANGPRSEIRCVESFKEGRKLSCPLPVAPGFGFWSVKREGCWVGIWLIAMRILGGLGEGLDPSYIDVFLLFFFSNLSRAGWTGEVEDHFWKFFFFFHFEIMIRLIRFDDEELERFYDIFCRSVFRKYLSESFIGSFTIGSIFNTLKSCTEGKRKHSTE